jgi:hypothetical protein
MEFLKERVYTSLNANELKVGSQVFVANSLEMLKRYVTESEITYRLDNIQDEDNPYRFMISNDSCYNLAYLVSEPEEEVERERRLKELEQQIEKMKSDLLELRNDSYDSGMYLRVDELVQKWGIKE